MDLGPLRTLALSINLSTHGVAAVVTRPAPDNTPITTRVIWGDPIADGQPYGTDLKRAAPRRAMAIPIADVPSLPSGTRIVAALPTGGAELTWVFDGYADGKRDSYWPAIVKQVQA